MCGVLPDGQNGSVEDQGPARPAHITPSVSRDTVRRESVGVTLFLDATQAFGTVLRDIVFGASGDEIARGKQIKSDGSPRHDSSTT